MGRRRRSLLGRKGKKDAQSTAATGDQSESSPFFSVPENLAFEESKAGGTAPQPEPTPEPEIPDHESEDYGDELPGVTGSESADSGVDSNYAPLPSLQSSSPGAPPSDVDDEPSYVDDDQPSYVDDQPSYVDESPAIPDPTYEDQPTWEEQSSLFNEGTLDPPAPEPQTLTGTGEYSSAGMDFDGGDAGGNDADFMNDLYGAFGEAPPTEEIPGGLYQDVSQPYNAPMNVPEPPPIPGIADRFTPPPVSRTDVGSRNPDRPSYLATPTPAPEPRAKLPPTPSSRDYDDEIEERRGPPMGLILVAMAVMAFAFVAVGLVMFLVGTKVVAGDPDAAPLVDEHEGVEVRGNMRQTPKVFGEVDDDEKGTDPTAPPDGEDGDDDGTEDTDSDTVEKDDGGQEAAPAPGPAPAPQASPGPRRPQPTAPAPQPSTDGVKGTLKIRSNRRVLVYVNGAAVGYTPQDYKVQPGDYSVSAMVPGQPGTKQTIDTSLAQPGQTQAVDFSF